MKERSAFHKIPIYEVMVEVVLSDDLHASAHNKKRERWLEIHPDDDYSRMYGCVTWKRDRFLLMLDRDGLSHATVGHEVFHLTHRIMQFVGVDFIVKCHEAHALLHGSLIATVYSDLKSWRAKLT